MDTIYFSEPKQRNTYNKRVRLYFGAKIPKGRDYSTQYDYTAPAGTKSRRSTNVRNALRYNVS